jgi:hypothetical protein
MSDGHLAVPDSIGGQWLLAIGNDTFPLLSPGHISASRGICLVFRHKDYFFGTLICTIFPLNRYEHAFSNDLASPIDTERQITPQFVSATGIRDDWHASCMRGAYGAPAPDNA